MESATKNNANRFNSIKESIKECADMINEIVQKGQL